MKKTFKFFLSIAVILGLLHSCAYDIDSNGGLKGNGTVVLISRPVASAFNTIIASEDLKVYVTQGDSLKITVESDENIIDRIVTEIEKETLRIHTLKGIGRATKNIYVTLPRIKTLRTDTGAGIKGLGTIVGDSLYLNGRTGSVIVVNTKSDYLRTEGMEGARITISGIAKEVRMAVSSGSDIQAEALQSTTCQINASYGGKAKINVSEVLFADASTGGNILFTGGAQLKQGTSKSGTVTKY